ncbi:MAG: hypothetical protein AAF213_07855 [Pseudomonadota bacterium]
MAQPSRPRLIEQRIDQPHAAPSLPVDFPDIIELCDRDDQGAHIFPEREAFFGAAKTGQLVMQEEPRRTLDDYLDQFIAHDGHAAQKIEYLASTVRAALSRRHAFVTAEATGGPGHRPAVEVIVPRKAVFDGNMAAITLGEHMADRLTKIAPYIEWRVAYDVVYQAPMTDPNAGRPAPRRHPKYGKQSLFMATESFGSSDRAAYVIGVDDTSRFGRAFRDLHLFAAQNGKELLAVAAFQAYEADNLRPSLETQATFRRAFQGEMDKLEEGLAAFGLNTNTLTETEMRFFTSDPMLDPKPGASRADTALAYLEDQAAHHALPTLLPHNDHFIKHVAAGKPLRFSERPAVASAYPAPQNNATAPTPVAKRSDTGTAPGLGGFAPSPV